MPTRREAYLRHSRHYQSVLRALPDRSYPIVMSGHDSLWAPWRMQYIRQLGAPDDVDGAAAGSGCFICDAVDVMPGSEAARQHHVLLNDSRGLIMLNRYPYTNGHLLIAPADHVAALNSLQAVLSPHSSN